MKPTFNLSAWALAHQQLVSFFYAADYRDRRALLRTTAA